MFHGQVSILLLQLLSHAFANCDQLVCICIAKRVTILCEPLQMFRDVQRSCSEMCVTPIRRIFTHILDPLQMFTDVQRHAPRCV